MFVKRDALHFKRVLREHDPWCLQVLSAISDIPALLKVNPLQHVLPMLVHVVATHQVAAKVAKNSHHSVVNNVEGKFVLTGGVLTFAEGADPDSTHFKGDVPETDRATHCKSTVEAARTGDVRIFQFRDWTEIV